MAATHAHPVGETRTEKGVSLARGPALILGTILLAAGLYFLYKQHNFPRFSTNFPHGDAPVDGKVFGIFGANGWTGMLTAVAGGLLLFGAAQHLLAKTMSLIVGVALGAAAVIAAINGDVLGMAAANTWTEIAWGAAAAILLFNTMVPRRRRTVPEYGYERGAGDDDAYAAGAAGDTGGHAETQRYDDAAATQRYDDAAATRRYDDRDEAETRVAGHREEPATERLATPDDRAEDETREVPAARREESGPEVR
jgi:hypothetical protein